jgi:hypothetical protein
MRARAVLLAMLALGAPGCAMSDEDLHRELLAERTETLLIVTPAELKDQPPGSPGRTLLRLWRAVQFRNPPDVLSRLSPSPSPTQAATIASFILAGAAKAPMLKPRILESQTSGDRASVLVEFVRGRKVGDQLDPFVTGRLPVELRHTKSGWLVLWRKAVKGLPEAIL